MRSGLSRDALLIVRATAVVLAAMLAAGCSAPGPTIVTTTNTTSPAGTTTASTSPIGDSCLVGSWVAQNVDEPTIFTVGSTIVPLSGQSGVVFSFAADGTEVDDYNNSQPLDGVYNGTPLRLTMRGTATSKVVADGTKAVETGSPTTFSGNVTVGGIVVAQPSIDFSPVTFDYACSATRLDIHDPGGTNLTFARQ
jgi:hypothetical protein